jgi:calcineurin-like phosphoesterase family protein
MFNIFFTSDQHFNHSNVIKYSKRPHFCIEAMNEDLIERWNEVVKKGDLVYHLGDFAFGDPTPFRKRLNGQIILIEGNHDHMSKKVAAANFIKVCQQYRVKSVDPHIWLCHYRMYTWPQRQYGVWHLYGHSHNRSGDMTHTDLSLDVGVDCWNFYPVSYNQIQEKMQQKIQNLNIDINYKGDTNELFN